MEKQRARDDNSGGQTHPRVNCIGELSPRKNKKKEIRDETRVVGMPRLSVWFTLEHRFFFLGPNLAVLLVFLPLFLSP